MFHAENLALAVSVDADRDNHRPKRCGRSGRFHVSCVDLQILLSISAHSRLTWPLMPITCMRSSTERVETPCT